MQATRGGAALVPVGAILTLLYGGGLLVAVLQSLGGGEGGPLTLTHYRALGGDAEWQAALGVTVVWATAATAISGVLGVGLALALRHLARGSETATALLQVPVAVPHLAMAAILVHLLGQSGLVARLAFAMGWIDGPAGFPALLQDRYGVGILLAYVWKETPFLALVALAMLRRGGTELEDVAATLGASRWQRFRHVTLPFLAPAVVSSSLLVFAFVFGSFEVPFLLGRPYPAMLGVLVQRRYLGEELAARPAAVAAAVAMSAVAGGLVWAYLRVSRRVVGERPTLF